MQQGRNLRYAIRKEHKKCENTEFKIHNYEKTLIYAIYCILNFIYKTYNYEWTYNEEEALRYTYV